MQVKKKDRQRGSDDGRITLNPGWNAWRTHNLHNINLDGVAAAETTSKRTKAEHKLTNTLSSTYLCYFNPEPSH